MNERHMGVPMRILIVLSLLWLVGNTAYQYSHQWDMHVATAGNVYESCHQAITDKPWLTYDGAQHAIDSQKCDAEFKRILEDYPPIWQMILESFALSAIVLGLVWIVAGISGISLRFILRGRRVA